MNARVWSASRGREDKRITGSLCRPDPASRIRRRRRQQRHITRSGDEAGPPPPPPVLACFD